MGIKRIVLSLGLGVALLGGTATAMAHASGVAHPSVHVVHAEQPDSGAGDVADKGGDTGPNVQQGDQSGADTGATAGEGDQSGPDTGANVQQGDQSGPDVAGQSGQ